MARGVARPAGRRVRDVDSAGPFAVVAGGLVFVFLALPIIVIVVSAFSPTAFPEVPPSGFSLKWFEQVFTDKGWMRAIQTSLFLLLIVTPSALVLGTLAAYALHRLRFRGVELVQSFIMSPLMIPQIVLGIALLYVFSSAGFSGSLGAMAIGQIVIVMPYVVRCVNASLAGLDTRLIDASMSLGATPAATFRRVTLPLIRPGIIAGAVFAAVESFGEASVSLFLSAPTTTPVSVRIFNYIEQSFDPSVTAVSVIFVVVSIVVLVVIDRTIGLAKAM